MFDEYSKQTCRRCGWSGLTQARQLRIGVTVGLLVLFIALSLTGGPRWLLWLAAALGFAAIAAVKEVCPSCQAGPNDLRSTPSGGGPGAPAAPESGNSAPPKTGGDSSAKE